MNPAEVREHLVNIFPALEARFDGSSFRESDGTLDYCGVFAECGHYIREYLPHLSRSQLARLGEFASRCMATAGTELDEAAATCLLENLAFEPGADALLPYLSGDAAAFVRQFGQA